MENYFASEDVKKTIGAVEEKLKDYCGYLESTGVRQKWLNSYRLYYGKHFATDTSYDEQNIVDLGETGELKGVAVNHYRNFINHILSLTTSQKPTWQCRALNSDLKSLQQTKLGNTILDNYFMGKRLLRKYKKAAEYALVIGQGFIYSYWEKSSGKVVMQEPVDEGKYRNVYEGDAVVDAISPMNYFTDYTLTEWDERSWECVKRFRNKYDLAARYPDKASDIIEVKPDRTADDFYKWWSFSPNHDSDLVPVFEFYHKRTDALPNGRYILFLNEDIALYDGPIPYDKLPCDRIVQAEIHDTTQGYSDAWDLMPLQESFNVLFSSIYTNQQAFAVQNILIPRTANISVETLSKNLAGIKYDPQGGKPEGLQLTQSPPEVFQMLSMIERLMETISGVNSVARGNPESSLKSGVALAMVQSMAVQYASKFQESWAFLLEDGGTKIFDYLKQFAKTERIAEMSGRINRGRIQSFTGEDVNQVQRVAIELGNPLQRTTAGKVQIADSLLEKGMVKTPQQYLQVMETGNLDPLVEGPEAELDLIRGENELMMEAKFEQVRVLVGDAHLLHVQEHKCLLSNPLVRSDEQIVAGILAHIQEHKELYETQDPFWSQISGEPPSPQSQAPQPDLMAMPPEGVVPEMPEVPENMAQPPVSPVPPMPV
jgi:hypothetical protein